MTRYLIKRTTTYNGNTSTYYVGKQDMDFRTLNDGVMSPWLVREYGFCTIPAAKRSGAWQNRHHTGFVYTIKDTRIVRVDLSEFGGIKSITEEEL